MKIKIINGPNLNLLGKREPEIYGKERFEEYLITLQSRYKKAEIDYSQSNSESKIVELLHKASEDCDAVILNAASFTHTSIAIADAIATIDIPVIEIHISNVYQRERFRHFSYVSPHAKGMIIGFGLKGYQLAMEACLNL